MTSSTASNSIPTQTKLKPLYVKRRYVSISSLLEFARCRRRYFYDKSGLRGADSIVRMHYGTSMHKAVATSLITHDTKQSLEAFNSVWTENLSDELHNTTNALRSLEYFTHSHASGRSLYKLLPPPEGSLVTDEKDSDYEVPWAIDIGLDVPLTGRFDGICEHRDTKELYVFEFKTTSRLTSAFIDAFEMNPQVLTYALVGRTIVGENIKGIMLEGMLKDKKKVDNMTYPIPVPPGQVDDILRWLQDMGQQLLDCEAAMEHPLDARPFLKDFDGCTPYPHFYMPGYRCEYSDMCRVDDWQKTAFLYRVEEDHDFLRNKEEQPVAVTVKGVEVVK